MSLISLIYGGSKKPTQTEAFKEVTRPLDNIQASSGERTDVKVKAVCQFVGQDEIFMVGEVLSGVLEQNMRGSIGENAFDLIEIESKYGVSKAKQGMTVGLTLSGIRKEALKRGEIVRFCLPATT
ncbi:MAG: hypothetical protein J4224_02125 [Candidatus Diapherotrites archaeon]|uniref:Translation elongation factor EFTu-like domain-containing protein n=1 Tax=Candidatus Iainarchaeum sp. TaxID=3101447 RepID=A0A7J4IYY1_9ARCH|nr:MAG: hypothetical protein QT03_C0001G0216 [archaeon GW2011_AR10]MBS3059202.1 hypothetical protein [Candidatus Diapherotrites archaeon]HIH08987.1 hypothetical protein [Candidatus Diapherotrites archaeon]